MSEFATLTVKKRLSTGKGANRRLRAQGIIPAVFYTAGGNSVSVQVEEAPLKKLFEKLGRTTVFNVEIEDGDKKEVAPALIWDVDFYPIKNRMQHVDFFGLDLNKELKLRIPLEFSGTAKGAKLGGILDTFIESVELCGKPLALPSKLIVDVSSLDLGQSIRVADLVLPEGTRPAGDTSRTVALIKDKAGLAEDSENSGA